MKPKNYYFEDGRPKNTDPKKFTMTRGKAKTACWHQYDIRGGKFKCLKCNQLMPATKAHIDPKRL